MKIYYPPEHFKNLAGSLSKVNLESEMSLWYLSALMVWLHLTYTINYQSALKIDTILDTITTLYLSVAPKLRSVPFSSMLLRPTTLLA